MVSMSRRQFFGVAAAGTAALCAPSIVRAKAPTTLRFTNFAGPTSFLTTGIFRPFFDKIEAASEGTLKIDIYSGGSLAGAKHTYDAVRKGIADMGWGVTSYTPGRFNVATIVELPFEAKDCATASHGLWTLYENDMLDGFKGVEVLSVMSSGIQHAHAAQPVKGLDDFDGLRVRAAGAAAAMMWEAFGAIPIALPVPAIAESLSKNTLNGSMNDWNALKTWGILEFLTAHVDVPMGSSPCFLTMNKAVFDGLPEPAKKALKDHSGPVFNGFWAAQLDGENQRLRADVAAMADHTIITPTADDMARWKATVAPVAEKWTGLVEDGPRILDTYLAALAEVR